MELDQLQLEWDDAERGTADIDRDLGPSDLVVTVGTTVPLRPNARRLDEFGAGPNLTFGYLTGANSEWANRYHERLHDLAPVWRLYERLLHFYRRKDWPRFNAAGRELAGDGWRDARNSQERLIAALRPAQVMLLPLLPGDSGGRLVEDYSPTILKAIHSASFGQWAVDEEASGALVAIESRLFQALQAYVREWEAWSAGILVRATEPSRVRALAKLRLFRDEFPVLRDLYVQAFETCCAALPFAAGIINCALRGDPDAFGDVPRSLIAHNPKAQAPRSLKKFADLPNSTKLHWFEDWPHWNEELPRILDKDLRNSLGHASATHDIATGRVVGERLQTSYLELTANVMELGHAILMLLQITKSARLHAMDERQ